MSNSLKVIFMTIAALSLGACSSAFQEAMYTERSDYNYSYYGNHDSNSNYYSGNYSNNQSGSSDGGAKPVHVPQSYHVGNYNSPVSHKKRDRSWVNRQNPNSYTIKVAEDQKPANVAKKLHGVPRDQRAAQIRTQRNGKPSYTGVYGTYNSVESAQQALNNLPRNVKKNAKVKNWRDVQQKQQ
jgi:hypothetical protein